MTEKETIVFLFERYLKFIQDQKNHIEVLSLPEKCSYDNLVSLSNEAISNSDKYPNDKLQRWLGFTQGVLATIGVIDVDQERDFTRKYLHAYHSEKIKSFG